MSKGRNLLTVVSLIVALSGGAIGVYSFISLNIHTNATNSYILPKARVYYDGPTYTILSGGGNVLFNYNHKSHDTHEAFNLTSDSYTIPETGYYEVIAQYSIYAADGGFFNIQLYSNDILVSSRSSTSSAITNVFGVTLTDIINFNKGDSINVKVYQYNSGSLSRNIYSGEEYTFFAIAKLS
ncbi:MAG: hypothetical protein KGD67_02555 [Candidatus Lokiarchaeota archaeon]|nr:hypothetical protein [Candidatus Lokiarchaeota archaeon]